MITYFAGMGILVACLGLFGLAAAAAMLVVVVVAVGSRTLRAARANPVDSLRYE